MKTKEKIENMKIGYMIVIDDIKGLIGEIHTDNKVGLRILNILKQKLNEIDFEGIQ